MNSYISSRMGGQNFNVIAADTTYNNIKEIYTYCEASTYDPAYLGLSSSLASSLIICAPSTMILVGEGENSSSLKVDSGNYEICVSDQNGTISRITPGFTDISSYFQVNGNKLELSSEILESINKSSETTGKLTNYTLVKDGGFKASIGEDGNYEVPKGYPTEKGDSEMSISFEGLLTAYNNLRKEFKALEEKLKEINNFTYEGDGGDIIINDLNEYINYRLWNFKKELAGSFVQRYLPDKTKSAYLWTGTKNQYDGLDDTEKHYGDTSFIINPIINP